MLWISFIDKDPTVKQIRKFELVRCVLDNLLYLIPFIDFQNTLVEIHHIPITLITLMVMEMWPQYFQECYSLRFFVFIINHLNAMNQSIIIIIYLASFHLSMQSMIMNLHRIFFL